MTTYAVNNKAIIAVWSDGASLRWATAAPVNDLLAAEEIANRLRGVSQVLWHRCEYIGERDRLSAIVRSGLRRNGSEEPNRRRPKTEATNWDRRTQQELTAALRPLDAAMVGSSDAVRSSIRSEVLRELDAVCTWAAGGQDPEGRSGQNQLPTSQRLQAARLDLALRSAVTADRSFNEFTAGVHALLLAAAAVSLLGCTPAAQGLTTTEIIQRLGVAAPDELFGRCVRALDLVIGGHDAVTTLRAAFADASARQSGLVDLATCELFPGVSVPCLENPYPAAVGVFGDLLERTVQSAALVLPHSERAVRPGQHTDPGWEMDVRVRAVVNTARRLAERVGCNLTGAALLTP